MEDLVKFMKYLHLGEWITTVVVTVLLWRYVFKSLFELWFTNKLAMHKEDVATSLQLQKDLAIRKAEFEKVKLERALPLLESITECLYEHQLMFSSYISAVLNNHSLPERIEKLRLEKDKALVHSVSISGIYLPEEMRGLLQVMRKIVSCSWVDPSRNHNMLKELGDTTLVPLSAQDIYQKLFGCFQTMSNMYIGIDTKYSSYAEILADYEINSEFALITNNPIDRLAWVHFLMHEYFGSNEIVEAQNNAERYIKKLHTQDQASTQNPAEQTS